MSDFQLKFVNSEGCRHPGLPLLARLHSALHPLDLKNTCLEDHRCLTQSDHTELWVAAAALPPHRLHLSALQQFGEVWKRACAWLWESPSLLPLGLGSDLTSLL